MGNVCAKTTYVTCTRTRYESGMMIEENRGGGNKRPDLMGFVFFPMNEWMNGWNTEDEWMDDLYPVHGTLLSYPEYKSFSKSPSNDSKAKKKKPLSYPCFPCLP